MGSWYGYNIIKNGEIIDTETDFGTGVITTPKKSLVEGIDFDEAFLYYVNDTSDTGEMIHLPSRDSYKFKIYNGKPYYRNVENPEEEKSIFDKYDYDLTLCGNYIDY